MYELTDARNIINTYNGFLKALLYYEMSMLDSFRRHFIWVRAFTKFPMILFNFTLYSLVFISLFHNNMLLFV